jgi:AraC family transcriptional regulator, regulatory protein of adaptative response / methylated-DNA-[protein]-cysteine methyltransferase
MEFCQFLKKKFDRKTPSAGIISRENNVASYSRISAEPMNVTQADDARWASVLNRDRDADGEFVYAVKTTGVYCRASCPSRTAKRKNVEFFETTFAARSAGYRACKRCHPDGVSHEHAQNTLVAAACETIKRNPHVTLAALADEARLSAHHFHRVFKQVTGLTPKAYQKSLQTQRVSETLRDATSVTEAIYDAGFNSVSRFYEDASDKLGMAPSRYRSGAVGEEIRYAAEPCALGVIIIAATQRGVCAIEFGDSAHTLVARIRERFPKAALRPADAEFKKWIGQILAYIEQPRGVLDLPLDVQGTVFQQRVWNALKEIPAGSTASYADVANKIGQPRAVRAVAQACASNTLAVAIPCHRVVRADGTLSGYRWGAERKAALLKREKK